MAKVSPTIIVAGAALIGIGLILALRSASKKLPPPKPGPLPDDKPSGNDLRKVSFPLPGVELVDMRQKAPADIVRQIRKPSDIRAVVLHQTGFAWTPDNKLWPEVKSHFTVMQDGQVYFNHHPEEQLRFGSSLANPFSITIEHEGNYPSDAGKWYKPEIFGSDKLQDYPEQVSASRALIKALKARYPTITHVYAHRQWESPKKANCPGPDIWRASGEWSKKALGLKDGGEGWHYAGGAAIPVTWTVPWSE